MRLSWDQFFMAQSHLIANRSTCSRLAVGAIIVRDRRMISAGYNGSISGGIHCSDEGCYVIDGHCVRTIHAEMNAILQCAKFGVPTQGSEIYVTHFPCLQCCKAIIQSGITTVYYANDYKNHPYAIELFESAKVETVHVPYDKSFEEQSTQDKLSFVAELLNELEAKQVDQDRLKAHYERAQELFTKG